MRCWNRSCGGGVVQLDEIEDGVVELHGGQPDLCSGGGGRHRCRHLDLGAAAIMDHCPRTVSEISEVLLDGAFDNVEFLFLPPSSVPSPSTFFPRLVVRRRRRRWIIAASRYRGQWSGEARG